MLVSASDEEEPIAARRGRPDFGSPWLSAIDARSRCSPWPGGSRARARARQEDGQAVAVRRVEHHWPQVWVGECALQVDGQRGAAAVEEQADIGEGGAGV